MIELKNIAIKQEKLLYTVLGTNKLELEQIIKDKDLYYYSFEKLKKDNRGKIVYENGIPKKRNINATKGRLNELQVILNKKILSKISLPANVTGGVKGNSNISNAQAHLGKHYKFKTDIKKYFPSIKHERVFKMFLENGFSRKVSTLLTHLTTNKYQLPQGTPTSTSMANLIFVPHDTRIIDYCKLHNLTYTRYVDDLVFSSHFDFRQKILDIVQFIFNAGFKISVRKTIYKVGDLEITGVWTKQNILDATSELKELVADPTIDVTITEARRKYISRIRSISKKSPFGKKSAVEEVGENNNNNIFEIDLTYKGRKHTYVAELINYGYSYTIKVNINGRQFFFEPDEERKLRVTVNKADLKEAKKMDSALLREIVNAINIIFKK